MFRGGGRPVLSTLRPLWPQQPLPPALSHLNCHSSDTLSGSGVPVTKCHIRGPQGGSQECVRPQPLFSGGKLLAVWSLRGLGRPPSRRWHPLLAKARRERCAQGVLRDQDQGSGQAELRGHHPELELHLCSGWALWDPGRLAPATDGSRLSWSLGTGQEAESGSGHWVRG